MSTRRIERRLRAILSASADRRPLDARLKATFLFVSIALLLPLAMIRAESPATQQESGHQQHAEANQAKAGSSESSASRVDDTASINADESSPIPADEVQQTPAAEFAKSSKTQSLRISGTVVDPADVPIRNALVLLRTWNLEERCYNNFRARSNQHGDFELEFPESNRENREWYPIWVWAPGHQLQAALMGGLLADKKHVRDARFQLPKANPITFRILKPNGQPCPNSLLIPGSVSVFRAVEVAGSFAIDPSGGLGYPVGDSDDLIEILGANSGDDGNVRLANIPSRLFDRVDVISDEFGTQRFGVRADTHKLQLAAVGEIRGQVLIDEPSRIAGTRFMLQAYSSGQSEARAEVRLDKNGRFQVPAFAAGASALSVYTYEWDKSLNVHPFLDRRARKNVRPGEILNLVIDTVRTVRVTGQVLTADTRDPVVGAKATLNCLSSPVNGVRELTDQEGRFSIRVAPGIALRQVTSMGDDKSLYDKYDYPRLANVEIPSGVEEYQLEPFLLTPKQIVRGTVRGRIRDATGAPIAGATLTYHYRKNGRILARTVTDDQGRFVEAVRDWHTIQQDRRIADRYQWSILNDDKQIKDGYLQRDFTTLIVIKSDPNAMILERP